MQAGLYGVRLGVLHFYYILFSCYSLRSGGILADLVFVSALLPWLALITQQELLPLVGDGHVDLRVQPVGAADVPLPRPILDDKAGSFPAVSDEVGFLFIVLAPVEEVVVALEDVVAHDRVVAIFKRLIPLDIVVAKVLGKSTGVLLLVLPRHLYLEVLEPSQLLQLLLALLLCLLLLGQQLLV